MANRKKHKKIFLIDPVGGQGGMDFLNHQLCENISQDIYKMTLITSSIYSQNKTHDAYCYFNNVFLSNSKYLKALRYIKGMIKTLFHSVKAGIKVFHFQIFHVGLLQFIFVLLSLVLRRKIIITAHDVGSFRDGEKKFLLQNMYKLPHEIIVHSEVAYNLLLQTGIDSKKINLIPLGNFRGLLGDTPSKSCSKKMFGFSDSDFVVLFFGQCKKVKRLDVLINAVSLAKENGFKNIKLLVAGPMTDADDIFLRNLLEDKLDKSYLHISKFIPNEELSAYFSAADIAVLPYDNIMQSGVILLAISNKVPVIVSNIPGMLEVVRHGVNGLVFKKADIKDLNNRLLEIHNGIWDLDSLVAESNLLLDKKYSWEICTNLTEQVYEKI